MPEGNRGELLLGSTKIFRKQVVEQQGKFVGKKKSISLNNNRRKENQVSGEMQNIVLPIISMLSA